MKNEYINITDLARMYGTTTEQAAKWIDHIWNFQEIKTVTRGSKQRVSYCVDDIRKGLHLVAYGDKESLLDSSINSYEQPNKIAKGLKISVAEFNNLLQEILDAGMRVPCFSMMGRLHVADKVFMARLAQFTIEKKAA